MTTSRSAMIERLLVGAIALIFCLPLPLSIVRNNQQFFLRIPILGHPWMANRTLHGESVRPADVHFSWPALLTGDFQRSKAALFNERFPGREAFIRWTSEVWFRLFHESVSPSLNLAVGVNRDLFEKSYLQEYFLNRTEKRLLAPWVEDLRRLQNFCRSAGTGFVVVISPSKVALYPEQTPREWRRWRDPRPRAYDLLVELFREHGIHFVDGPAILAAEKNAHPPSTPFFPQGGVHWNDRGAWLITNAVQTQLRAQGQPVTPLLVRDSTISLQPEGRDYDLAALLSPARPLLYPCEKLTFQRIDKPRHEQRTMAVIGGSFSWDIVRLLSLSGQFSEISDFFYYRASKNRAVNGERIHVRAPGTPEDFGREIFGADCLLLELNEATAPQPSHHLADFLRDALAHLPDPSAPRLPFRSD